MTLKLNGIELELPDGAEVQVSEDGKRVTVTTKPVEVVEKIRFVDSGEPKVIEKIVVREIEVEKPCTRPHYSPYTWPNTYPWSTTTGTGNGITWSSPSTITCGNTIR